MYKEDEIGYLFDVSYYNMFSNKSYFHIMPGSMGFYDDGMVKYKLIKTVWDPDNSIFTDKYKYIVLTNILYQYNKGGE